MTVDTREPVQQLFRNLKAALPDLKKLGESLDAPPQSLPSGWAAFLYLYGLR